MLATRTRGSRAILALDDGAVFPGTSLGMIGETIGEVVFNTALTGYQEILTDPSYKGQIVTMTYPLIGNYGVNPADVESESVHVEGFVIKELSARASNYRSSSSLDEYLRKYKIVGIQGLDTRRLTRHLRTHGARMGIISSRRPDAKSLVAKAKAAPPMSGRDFVRETSCREMHAWTAPVPDTFNERRPELAAPRFKVVAVDCGIKQNILRSLVSAGCAVTVAPAVSKAADILALKPDGVLLSNGPGDPRDLEYLVSTARALLGCVPIFGICLGHQVLSLALGGKIIKLKFGHHGGNHPVLHVPSGRVEITSQNHNYAADPASLPAEVEVTHLNLNDRTVEGLECRKLSVSSLQYHPEASPGPHDSAKNFGRFLELMEKFHAKGGAHDA